MPKFILTEETGNPQSILKAELLNDHNDGFSLRLTDIKTGECHKILGLASDGKVYLSKIPEHWAKDVGIKMIGSFISVVLKAK